MNYQCSRLDIDSDHDQCQAYVSNKIENDDISNESFLNMFDWFHIMILTAK